MLHRSTHPTPLSLILNLASIGAICFALYLTREPLVLLALALISPLPFVPDELQIKMAQILHEEDDEESAGAYQRTRVGFTPNE